jgi:hypothetical protein
MVWNAKRLCLRRVPSADEPERTSQQRAVVYRIDDAAASECNSATQGR